MNPKHRTLLLFAAGVAFSISRGVLSAQTALTWDDCVRDAAAQNPDLRSAEENLKAAGDTHAASLGQFFPQVSLNASISRSGPGGLEDGLNGPDYDQNADLSLNLQQDIFSGFKDFASVDQSNAQWDLARAELTQTKAQLSHDLKVDFYQLLYSQRQLTLLDSIVERQKANMELVGMNFKGGTDNKGSYLQAQAAYEEAKFEYSQAQRSLRVAQRQLAQVLGLDRFPDLVVKGDFKVPSLDSALPSFKSLTIQAPAYKEALAQLHLAQSGYVTARGAFFPTLSANASLYSQGYNFDEGQPGWSAGLQLSLPLFTGGRNLFTFKNAEENEKASEADLQSAVLRVDEQLESSYASYENAVDQIQVLQLQLKAAQTQEEIAKAEYLNGLLIFENWSSIEDNLTNQEKAQLSGFLNLETAQANWELAQGKGVIP
jgi:outer membrane protein